MPRVQQDLAGTVTPQQLRAWREARGWSQQRLADALGVPVNTVARWERAELPIRHGTILHLALRELARTEIRNKKHKEK
jgi:transcriptional regulator with XRE-family HTH domain